MEIDEEQIKEEFENSLGLLKEYGSELTSDSLQVWYQVYLHKIRIYANISRALFTLNLATENGISKYDEDLQTLILNITLLKDSNPQNDHPDYSWEEFISKITDHVELVRLQMSRIYDSVEISKSFVESNSEKLELLEEQATDFDQKYNDLIDKQKRALKKAKKTQKDFIAILGIFASILVATFGGLTSLSSIFSKIDEVPTGKLILFGAFEVLAVLMIIFLLLNGIAKLSDLNLRSCGCSGEQTCKCKLPKKHPTIYLLSVLTVCIAFLGGFSTIQKYILSISSKFTEIWVSLTMGIVMIVFCIAAFIYAKISTNESDV